MITGVITADHEAIIGFSVRGQNGREQEVRAVVDTGFNGYLTLPESLVSTLGLSYHSQIIVTLGDGSDRILREYEATVVWDERGSGTCWYSPPRAGRWSAWRCSMATTFSSTLWTAAA